MDALETLSSILSSIALLLADETMLVFLCSIFVISLALIVALTALNKSKD